jgi:hypothetical protein
MCVPLTVPTTHNTVSILAMIQKIHAAVATGLQPEGTTTNIQIAETEFKKLH